MPRSHSASKTRVTAQIKQLCCLGLGPHAIAPPLTRLLLRMIPGHSASVFFSDDTGELVNIYDENPALIDVGPIYVNEFNNRREADVWIGFKETFERGLIGVMVEELIKSTGELGSEATCTTWFSGRSAATAASCGSRCVQRRAAARRDRSITQRRRSASSPKQRPRSPRIARAVFFPRVYVLRSSPAPLVESDADEDQGLIVADRDGRIRYLSRQARALLFLRYERGHCARQAACRGQAGVAARGSPGSPASLAQVFEGDAPATPPTYRQQNNWGELVFRAYWLKGQGARSPLIAYPDQPARAATHSATAPMDLLPLSRRQTEVSLHLAVGQNLQGGIAERPRCEPPDRRSITPRKCSISLAWQAGQSCKQSL